MPLDVLSRTRATMTLSTSICWSERILANLFRECRAEGLIFAIVDHEPGIPSKRKSLACADYVPAKCTHRPSLAPIE